MKKTPLILLSISCLTFAINLYAQKSSEDEEQQASEMNIQLNALADHLEGCKVFLQVFIHPFTGEPMERKITGIVDGKCLYSEQMPNDGIMDCEYSEEMRKAVADSYREVANADTSGTKIEMSVSTESGMDQKTTYVIDGVETDSPLGKAMSDGTCTISGY